VVGHGERQKREPRIATPKGGEPLEVVGHRFDEHTPPGAFVEVAVEWVVTAPAVVGTDLNEANVIPAGGPTSETAGGSRVDEACEGCCDSASNAAGRRHSGRDPPKHLEKPYASSRTPTPSMSSRTVYVLRYRSATPLWARRQRQR
jgi:hypothetical protein